MSERDDGVYIGLPSTYLTRKGFDRYRTMSEVVKFLDKRIEDLRRLASAPPLPSPGTS